MDELTKRLDGADHAGHGIGPAASRLRQSYGGPGKP